MKNNIARRDMVKQTIFVTGCICTCSIRSSVAAQSDCCNTPNLEPESYTIKNDRIVIDLTKASSLAKPGHAAFISDSEQEIELIVVRPDSDGFVALTRFCTHGRQVLSYNKHRRLLQCNSYNHSLFDLDGTVWKGPAPRPLDSYEIEQSDQILTIYL